MSKFKSPLVTLAALFIVTVIASPPAHAQERVPFQRTVVFNVTEGHENNFRIFDMNVGTEGDQTSTDSQCGTSGCEYTSSSIPAGRRVVIKYVTATAKLPTGQMVEIIITTGLKTTLGGATQTNAINHSFVPGNKVVGSKDWYVLSEMTEIYGSSGNLLSVRARRSATSGVAEIRVNISGYYEDESTATTQQ